MNPDLDKLAPYPFEKLMQLKADITPPHSLAHIALSIGEPQHAAPAFVLNEISTHAHGMAKYPLTKGSKGLRESIACWLRRRFALQQDSIDPEQHIIPVNGTREALFAFAQAVIDRSVAPLVLLPNPFYQIYEGAAILAGAKPYYLSLNKDNGFIPNFAAVPAKVWRQCQLLYVCTPGNPTGAVMPEKVLQDLIKLSLKYDFIIASDECYSEIYPDETQPPIGLLTAAQRMGHDDFRNCVVFHSLSKRSNLPGLRSGFVAGDPHILQQFLRYRTYHGCAMSPPLQAASIKAWSDEKHVKQNREQYREKFSAVIPILKTVVAVTPPDASFYLWLKTPMCDQAFTKKLFAEQNVTVLPGSFLSRRNEGLNPGENYVRLALVAETAECIIAAKRIKQCIERCLQSA